MEGVALRWRAATVVLQGLLVMIFLISGISTLMCHNSNTITLITPHKGNKTTLSSPVSGITNCSSDENICTDLQLKFTIEKEVLIMNHKGCAKKDLKGGTESINTGGRHFAIQFDESYCQGDLCNAITKTMEDSRNPIEDKEASGSHQCYAGFAWGSGSDIQHTITCGEGYDRCYQGRKNITMALGERGYSRVSIIFKTCQRPACDVFERQSFDRINITTDSEFCCSGSNCNGKEAGSLSRGSKPVLPEI